MKKESIVVVLVAVALLGGLYFCRPIIQVNTPSQQEQPPLSANSGTEHYNLENFYSGAAVSKYSGIGSVNASTTSSTLPYLYINLGAGTHGQFTLGTATPTSGFPSVSATATAVTLNSMVFVQQTSTTSIPGVTCNGTATVTPLTKIVFASSTNISNNGFTVTAISSPLTNPLCYDYWILDRSKGN